MVVANGVNNNRVHIGGGPFGFLIKYRNEIDNKITSLNKERLRLKPAAEAPNPSLKVWHDIGNVTLPAGRQPPPTIDG
jgi:hypothetical protein